MGDYGGVHAEVARGLCTDPAAFSPARSPGSRPRDRSTIIADYWARCDAEMCIARADYEAAAPGSEAAAEAAERLHRLLALNSAMAGALRSATRPGGGSLTPGGLRDAQLQQLSGDGSGRSVLLEEVLSPLAGLLLSGGEAQEQVQPPGGACPGASGFSRRSSESLPAVPLRQRCDAEDAPPAARPALLSPKGTMSAAALLKRRPWLRGRRLPPALAAAQAHLLLYAEGLQAARESAAETMLEPGRTVRAAEDLTLGGMLAVRQGTAGVVSDAGADMGSGLYTVRFDRREDGSARSLQVQARQLHAEPLGRVVPEEAVEWGPHGPAVKQTTAAERTDSDGGGRLERLTEILAPLADCLDLDLGADIESESGVDPWGPPAPAGCPAGGYEAPRGPVASRAPVVSDTRAVRTLCYRAGYSDADSDDAVALAGKVVDVLGTDDSTRQALVRHSAHPSGPPTWLPLSCLVPHAEVTAAAGLPPAEVAVIGAPSAEELRAAARSILKGPR
eukprot:TRINITY_DN8839_c0_g1_i1.p1 TRINITY_DN8839_c0_g1~~TRINITY_DN8839_c0_g1_i1.p1  ORF type:complete len:505 (+),score=128.93 TRINITY_DN8839_c0_g1_i1:117-1631(+)